MIELCAYWKSKKLSKAQKRDNRQMKDIVIIINLNNIFAFTKHFTFLALLMGVLSHTYTNDVLTLYSTSIKQD